MPSGSMQPTIYGVHYDDEFLETSGKPNFLQWLLSGQKYNEIKAENSGTLSVESPGQRSGSRWTYIVNSKRYPLPNSVRPLKNPPENISSGDTLWSSVSVAGDHVFVERLSYRFGDPKRGDIIVFKTDGIDGVRPGAFYIKRISGLPCEKVRIDPPYLLVNDQEVMEPEIFNIISSKSDGYSGFLLAHNGPKITLKLTTTNDCVTLGENEYFVTGDNSPNSLDCRYFDPVPRDNIVGKVTRIYYPFTRINKLR